MTVKISRRAALGVLGSGAMVPLISAGVGRALANSPQQLRILSTEYSIIGPNTRGLVSTRPGAPPPVLRLRKDEPFSITVHNDLPDYTAMHWHGIRVPNEMDGVPYLTQFPIAGGEQFQYSFTPADAGTFWYHPHCMTMDQMAMGLTGVLIVDETEDPGFDVDISLNLRDFRLDGEGQWLDLWTARGAARGGTFGTVMTANWDVEPTYSVPAGGLVRLRLAATDTTRIYRIFVPDAKGHVIALDGHPLRAPFPVPNHAENALVLAPGQRADLALVAPDFESQALKIMTDAPGPPRLLANLMSEGRNSGRDLEDLRPLAPNPVAEPDLTNARLEEFVFGWSPEDDLPNNGYCGTLGYTFWSINRQPWPGDAAPGTGPLATLRMGESVVMRLRNESPNAHPIHLHGLVFRQIRSNKRKISDHWTDTALLLKDETIDIALVADNPGDWAFHCHVIEHQKTGLAGFIRVLDPE